MASLTGDSALVRSFCAAGYEDEDEDWDGASAAAAAPASIPSNQFVPAGFEDDDSCDDDDYDEEDEFHPKRPTQYTNLKVFIYDVFLEEQSLFLLCHFRPQKSTFNRKRIQKRMNDSQS